MDRQLEVCHEAPFYTLGPLTTDIAPGYDHITSRDRRGDDRLVRHRHALLRDAQGAPRACPTSRTSRTASSPTRSPPTPPTSPRATRARASATTRSRGRASSSAGRTSSTSRSTRRRRGSFHDETLPAEGAKVAHFCSMCGPQFCSMKITQDVREYAREPTAWPTTRPPWRKVSGTRRRTSSGAAVRSTSPRRSPSRDAEKGPMCLVGALGRTLPQDEPQPEREASASGDARSIVERDPRESPRVRPSGAASPSGPFCASCRYFAAC